VLIIGISDFCEGINDISMPASAVALLLRLPKKNACFWVKKYPAENCQGKKIAYIGQKRGVFPQRNP
jgi:hypothetical protein